MTCEVKTRRPIPGIITLGSVEINETLIQIVYPFRIYKQTIFFSLGSHNIYPHRSIYVDSTLQSRSQWEARSKTQETNQRPAEHGTRRMLVSSGQSRDPDSWSLVTPAAGKLSVDSKLSEESFKYIDAVTFWNKICCICLMMHQILFNKVLRGKFFS